MPNTSSDLSTSGQITTYQNGVDSKLVSKTHIGLHLETKQAHRLRDLSTVVVAFETDLTRFLQTCKKDKKNKTSSTSSILLQLSELWKKYAARLSPEYLQDKLIAVGDILLNKYRLYELASSQCFDRYLDTIRVQYETVDDEGSEYSNVERLKKLYFPHLVEVQTIRTIRALFGKAMAYYYPTIAADPKVLSRSTALEVCESLKLIRSGMEIILPVERLSWLIYNGTTYIYTICRPLMNLGFAGVVVEFLIWSCLCMESVIPLLTVKYLPWRIQLYIAVCHCYLDLRLPQEADSFATRALTKISELQQLETSDPAFLSQSTLDTLEEARLNMNVILFRIHVFMDPSTIRRNISDHHYNVSSTTAAAAAAAAAAASLDRYLSDDFPDDSYRLWAICESLNPLRIGQPCAPDKSCFEGQRIVDLMARGTALSLTSLQYALQKRKMLPPSLPFSRHAPVPNPTPTKQSTRLPFDLIVRIICSVFHYKQWDSFRELAPLAITYARKKSDPSWKLHLITVELLQAMCAVIVNNDPPNESQVGAEIGGGAMGTQGLVVSDTTVSVTTGPISENASVSDYQESYNMLVQRLSDTLSRCIVIELYNVVIRNISDLLIDATVLLWNQCRLSEIDKKNNTSPTDWVTVVYKIFSVVEFATVDPIMYVSVLMRFVADREREGTFESLTEATHAIQDSLVQISNYISLRHVRSPVEAHICTDHTLHELVDVSEETSTTILTSTRSFMDQTLDFMHVDLLVILARIQLTSIRITNTSEIDDIVLSDIEKAKKSTGATPVPSFSDLMINCRKNAPVRALFLMQGSRASSDIDSRKNMLEHALSLLNDSFRLEAENIEAAKRVHIEDMQKQSQLETPVTVTQSTTSPSRSLHSITPGAETHSTGHASGKATRHHPVPPPPPVLVARSPTKISLVPAPWRNEPPSNTRDAIYSYRIYGKSTGSGPTKVALIDTRLPGTGDETIVNKKGKRPVFTVTGLKPNERYVFAIAAFTEDGRIIGGGISKQSRSIVAAHPLPVVACWSYLAQTAFDLGVYSVAKVACTFLWNIFVVVLPKCDNDMRIVAGRSVPCEEIAASMVALRTSRVDVTCTTTLRTVILSSLIYVDILIEQHSLFSDVTSDLGGGPFSVNETLRIKTSKHLLVALNLATFINDGNITIQVVVKCYGLLAPLVHARLASASCLGILLRCQQALRSVERSVLEDREEQSRIRLQRTFSCLTYFITVLLDSWGESDAADIALTGISETLSLLGPRTPGAAGALDTDGEDPLSAMPSVGGSKLDARRSGAKYSIAGNPASRLNARIPLKRFTEKHKQGIDDNYIDADSMNDGMVTAEAQALTEFLLTRVKGTSTSATRTATDIDAVHGDIAILLAVLATQPPEIAYRELTKFRRKSRYLEFVARTVEAAYRQGKSELGVLWCAEAVALLNRRNSYILHPTLYADTTAKKKKGSTGRDSRSSCGAATSPVKKLNQPPSINSKPGLSNQDPKADARGAKRRIAAAQRRLNNALTDSMTADEVNLLELKQHSMIKLEVIFPNYYRQSVARRKLRHVIANETPWRARMELLLGLCRIDVLVKHQIEKVNNTSKIIPVGTIDVDDPCMDIEWLSLETVGAFITGWGAVVPVIAQPRPRSVSTGEEIDEQLNTELGDAAATTAAGLAVAQDAQDDLLTILNHFSRCAVLAARGRCWVQLENACRYFSDCVNIFTLGKLSTSISDSGITFRSLCSAAWQAFFIISDMLLYMVDELERERPNQEKVGISDWMERFFLHTLRVLYDNARWQRAADFGARVNVATKGRMAHVVLPLVLHAYHECHGRNLPPDFVDQQRAALAAVRPHLGVGVSTLMTARRMLAQYLAGRISVVLSQIEGSNNTTTISTTNGFNPQLRRVGFRNETQEEPHSGRDSAASSIMSVGGTIPEGKYRLRSSVEHGPITIEGLPSVVHTYEKAIEILRSRNVSTQWAMAELGDLLFDSGQVKRAAYHWREALDALLGSQGSLKSWRHILSWDDRTMVELPVRHVAFERCNIWGCLAGAVLAGKLAKYTLNGDIGARLNACQLSAYLAVAIYQTNFPQPRRSCDFATYVPTDLGLTKDIFEDKLVLSVSSLLDVLEYISFELTRNGLGVQALPLLSLYEHISNDVCRYSFGTANARIMKVRVLTDLGLVSSAVALLGAVLCRADLPHPTPSTDHADDHPSDSIISAAASSAATSAASAATAAAAYASAVVSGNVNVLPGTNTAITAANAAAATTSATAAASASIVAAELAAATATPVPIFYEDVPLISEKNTAAIEFLCTRKLPVALSLKYGPYISVRVALAHAHLLTHLLSVSDHQVIPDLRVGDLTTSHSASGSRSLQESAGTPGSQNTDNPDQTTSVLAGAAAAVEHCDTANLTTSESMATADVQNLTASWDRLSKADFTNKSVVDVRRKMFAYTEEILSTVCSDETARILASDTAASELKASSVEDVVSADVDGNRDEFLARRAAAVIPFMSVEALAEAYMLSADLAMMFQRSTEAIQITISAMAIVSSRLATSQARQQHWAQLHRGGLSAPPRPDHIQLRALAHLDMYWWISARTKLIALLAGKGSTTLCQNQCTKALNEISSCNATSLRPAVLLYQVFVRIDNGQGGSAGTLEPVLRDIVRDAVTAVRFDNARIAACGIHASLISVRDSSEALEAYQCMERDLENHISGLCASTGSSMSGGNRKSTSYDEPKDNLYLPVMPHLARVRQRIGYELERLQRWNEAIIALQASLDTTELTCSLLPQIQAEARSQIAHIQIHVTVFDIMPAAKIAAISLDETKTLAPVANMALLAAIISVKAGDHNLSLIRRSYLDVALVAIHHICKPQIAWRAIHAASTVTRCQQASMHGSWVDGTTLCVEDLNALPEFAAATIMELRDAETHAYSFPPILNLLSTSLREILSYRRNRSDITCLALKSCLALVSKESKVNKFGDDAAYQCTQALHGFLVANVPRYAAECCLPSPPVTIEEFDSSTTAAAIAQPEAATVCFEWISPLPGVTLSSPREDIENISYDKPTDGDVGNPGNENTESGNINGQLMLFYYISYRHRGVKSASGRFRIDDPSHVEESEIESHDPSSQKKPAIPTKKANSKEKISKENIKQKDASVSISNNNTDEKRSRPTTAVPPVVGVVHCHLRTVSRLRHTLQWLRDHLAAGRVITSTHKSAFNECQETIRRIFVPSQSRAEPGSLLARSATAITIRSTPEYHANPTDTTIAEVNVEDITSGVIVHDPTSTSDDGGEGINPTAAISEISINSIGIEAEAFSLPLTLDVVMVLDSAFNPSMGCFIQNKALSSWLIDILHPGYQRPATTSTCAPILTRGPAVTSSQASLTSNNDPNYISAVGGNPVAMASMGRTEEATTDSVSAADF